MEATLSVLDFVGEAVLRPLSVELDAVAPARVAMVFCGEEGGLGVGRGIEDKRPVCFVSAACNALARVGRGIGAGAMRTG
jgi:hypothetical protein